LRRAYNVYTALALTALLMSLQNPFILWDTGFQLSFVGTLGILLFTPPLQHSLRFLKAIPLGSHIAEVMAVTLAAQSATLPIFALSFNQISFVAPLANLASVPLLGPLLVLSTLMCAGGLLALPLAQIGGWLAWPLLWYMTGALNWCAQLPGAYLLVHSLSPFIAWFYYALLALVIGGTLSRWQPALGQQPPHTPAIPRRARLMLQGSLAVLMLVTTGILTQTTRADGYLTLDILSNGNPVQGQALFLRSPSGQIALINQGASSATLAQTLDTRLPFWQRSLNLAVLSDTSAGDLAGLQDVITRYQIQRVVDGGMLHPSLAYARWRATLSTRGLPYTQARQGAFIALDARLAFQVLWPLSSLHKSSRETSDNALVLRLVSPGLRLLLLNTAALSEYALQTLTLDLPPGFFQAEVVQLVGEEGKAFPPALRTLLTLAHPSLLLLTLLPSHKRLRTSPQVAMPTPLAALAGPWEILQNQQTSALEIQSTGHGWGIHASG
jgi:competence protein ComEC